MSENQDKKSQEAKKVGSQDYSRSAIPQFREGLNGAGVDPRGHVFQGDRRTQGGKGKIIRLNRDGDIRRSATTPTRERVPGFINNLHAHSQRREALDQLLARINYQTGLKLTLPEFAIQIKNGRARDRTKMWTTESIDVAWIWSVPNAELHIPNKDPTKAPTKVTADVTITMNSHDGHHGSGPDWPHYGATIELGNLSRKDVTWAVDGKQTYEQMKAGDIQRSPPITQDLTLHVLCDVVPASQAADELMTEEEIKVARKMAGRSPSGSSEGEDEEQDQEDKKKGKKDKKEE